MFRIMKNGGDFMQVMSKAMNPAFWKALREDPSCAELIAQTKADYERLHYEGNIPVLSFAARKRLYEDGDRGTFETPYFRRRNALTVAAILALLYPEEDAYLRQAESLIWAVCDEYSWVVPAHCPGKPEEDHRILDLFTSETAFALAEIDALLGSRLHPWLRARIRDEVGRRVVENYERYPGTNHWEACMNNWGAVCAGNIGGAVAYLFPEKFMALLPRLTETMRCFLRGFPEDGTCMEGFDYWHYGFGNFVWFADLVLQFTDGQVDLFRMDPKIEAIAGYAQRSILKGGTTVSFSDGSRDGKVSISLQNYLAARFPDSIRPLPTSVTCYLHQNVWMMNWFRNFYYHDLERQARTLPRQDWDLPGAGQVILNRPRYSLAVKAGHNDEPHNHNDVGSFILATEQGQVFCDLGCGCYTGWYFGPKRYEIFCNGSQSHNVPIVNGAYQKPGRSSCGTISRDGSRVTVSFAEAYGQPEFGSLVRTMDCGADRIVLTDRFDPDYRSLTERFVTTREVKAEEGRVQVGDVTLVYDPACAALHVHPETHLLHGYQGKTETVYCIDLTLKPRQDHMTVMFEIGR